MKQPRKRSERTPLKSIQNEIISIKDDVAALGSSLGVTASDEVRSTMQSIGQRLDRIAGEAGRATEAGVSELEDLIRENPFATVAIAFGAGFVLSSMLRR